MIRSIRSKAKLVQKYSTKGPRYTSYPAVPHWKTAPSQEQWISRIAKSLKTGNGQGGVYVHIPYCQSLCLYCGCHKRISQSTSVGGNYVDALLKEWEIITDGLETPFPLADLHLGGGTPTFLTAEELKTLISGIRSRSNPTSDPSFSVEVDPRVTSKEQMAVLAELGFRRISMGIQDFDPKVQSTIHRIQPFEQVRDLTTAARELGYTSVNYDLIYGLPHQTLETITNTIQQVLQLRPDRIAFYSYAHIPKTVISQQRFRTEDLPQGDDKRKLYDVGKALLEKNGYLEIGMDHFALDSDALTTAKNSGDLHRNFMGYLDKPVHPLVGLGASAIGDTWDTFAQNEKNIDRYKRTVNEGRLPITKGHLLSEEDTTVRRLITELMTQFETRWDREPTPDYLKNVRSRLDDFIEDHLIEWSDTGCRVTSTGEPFVRNICMAFDSHLNQSADDTSRFSQTI